MVLKPNNLRQMMREGRVAAGAAVASFSPEVLDIAGAAGLHFVRIDHEHAFRRDGSTEQIVRAALAAGVAPVIRIDRSELALAPKILEIGAAGVIVAGMRSLADAEAVVQATRFPPLGERGYTPMCLSTGWGTADPTEWIRWSNTEPMVGVTVEHPDAVAVVEQIVALDGLDFVQFGWSDFSIALGLPAPDRNDPRVVAARAAVYGAANKAGKHSMMGTEPTPEATAEALRFGARMLEYGRDLTALLKAWRAAAKLVERGG